MTRLQSGAVRIQKEWHSLEEVVGAALRRTGKLLKDHEVHAEIPGDLPLVPMDASLVEQALVNLLENAAKYTPPRSAVNVAARVDKEIATVEIADRGPGFSDADLPRLFDKFYRGGGDNRSRPGVGLGLAIAHAAVTAHGGRIWAENREGGGAIFGFTLPLEGVPPAVADEVEDDER
jgi:two-component system sensor histidine kinase KdpD